jgi:hypothetical protein
MRLFFGQVSNIRLRPSPRVDIRAARAGEAGASKREDGVSTFFIGLGVAWVVCAILYAILKGVVIQRSLKKRFTEAGTLRGRSKADIIAAVGKPTSFSAQPAGKQLLQWMETLPIGAYHIGLLFDANGVCEGVTHEHDTMK